MTNTTYILKYPEGDEKTDVFNCEWGCGFHGRLIC